MSLLGLSPEKASHIHSLREGPSAPLDCSAEFTAAGIPLDAPENRDDLLANYQEIFVALYSRFALKGDFLSGEIMERAVGSNRPTLTEVNIKRDVAGLFTMLDPGLFFEGVVFLQDLLPG